MFRFKIGKLFFGVSQNHIFKDVKQISSKTVAYTPMLKVLQTRKGVRMQGKDVVHEGSYLPLGSF